jgi:hypothetical protein
MAEARDKPEKHQAKEELSAWTIPQLRDDIINMIAASATLGKKLCEVQYTRRTMMLIVTVLSEARSFTLWMRPL